MSDGKVHATASLLLAASFSVAAMATNSPDLFKCAVGSLVGVFVTPDLDLSNAGVVQGSFIRKKVGWFGERAWKWFWKGYSESFKHGQFASHFPVYSTIVRLLYVYFWIVLVEGGTHLLIHFLFDYNLQLINDFIWWGKMMFGLNFFYGLVSSDLIHYTLDKFTVKHIGEQ